MGSVGTPLRTEVLREETLYRCRVPLIVRGGAQTPETLEINFVDGKLFCMFICSPSVYLRKDLSK